MRVSETNTPPYWPKWPLSSGKLYIASLSRLRGPRAPTFETSPGIRLAHRAHECRHSGGILHALGARHFDAARDIDRERAHTPNGVTDVLRVQPTTQNGPMPEICWDK